MKFSVLYKTVPRAIWGYLKDAWSYLNRLYSKFSNDNCFLLAGGLSYFTLISLVPILVIIVGLLSYVIGQEAVKTEIYELVRTYMGEQSAQEVIRLIGRAHQPMSSIMTAVLGLATLAFTSSTLFINLKNSLNIIWGVHEKIEGGLLKSLKDRGIAFLMVLVVGLLLILSIILDAVTTTVVQYFSEYVPVGWVLGLGLIENLIFFIVLFLLFGTVYKVLPDAVIEWRDVRFAAGLTTVLFIVGRQLVSLYLGRSDMSTVFGPASAIILILAWVYYSALIFFLGAEITQMHVKHQGRTITLAESLHKEEAKEEQGKS
ncbi:MAG: YihY/virulence factor BrkB family protein [Desulfovibrionales bacterium]